jgi:hypothetical protein
MLVGFRRTPGDGAAERAVGLKTDARETAGRCVDLAECVVDSSEMPWICGSQTGFTSPLLAPDGKVQEDDRWPLRGSEVGWTRDFANCVAALA